MENIEKFYKNKKVFVTGHTGFKGSWLVSVLLKYGAQVTGYSKNDSKITLLGVPDKPGVAAKIFGSLAKENINVDMIVQNVSIDGKFSDQHIEFISTERPDILVVSGFNSILPSDLLSTSKYFPVYQNRNNHRFLPCTNYSYNAE